MFRAQSVLSNPFWATAVVLFGVLTLAITGHASTANAASQRIFKLGAQYKDHFTLPFELQGRWHRTRFIQNTTSSDLFKAIEEGEWDIRQVDDMVALTNPATGVRAMATITNIQEGTVTLTYDKPVDNTRWCRETLSLKPHGEQLTGEQHKACYKGDNKAPYFQALAYVTGHKSEETSSKVYNYLMLQH